MCENSTHTHIFENKQPAKQANWYHRMECFRSIPWHTNKVKSRAPVRPLPRPSFRRLSCTIGAYRSKSLPDVGFMVDSIILPNYACHALLDLQNMCDQPCTLTHGFDASLESWASYLACSMAQRFQRIYKPSVETIVHLHVTTTDSRVWEAQGPAAGQDARQGHEKVGGGSHCINLSHSVFEQYVHPPSHGCTNLRLSDCIALCHICSCGRWGVSQVQSRTSCHASLALCDKRVRTCWNPKKSSGSCPN